MTCKKLIEVSMPVKEIIAESVRDKSIRPGHISTLHLWWARRPLPVCRAVVFASLVYDPLDKNCPKQFSDAVKKLLKESQYNPYIYQVICNLVNPMNDARGNVDFDQNCL
jgi:adenine-specific DNA methylase